MRLGERFGVPPWQVERAPLDRVWFYLGVCAAEGEGLRMVEGLADDEDLIIWDDGEVDEGD